MSFNRWLGLAPGDDGDLVAKVTVTFAVI